MDMRAWRATLRVSIGLTLTAAWTVASGAEVVYRCPDVQSGSVIYTSEPCRDGARLDIAPGKADPAAIERLRRDEESFQQRQAAREARALEREIALAALQPRVAMVAPDASSGYGEGWYIPGFYGGYPGYVTPYGARDRGRPDGLRPHSLRSAGSVPAQPHNPRVPQYPSASPAQPASGSRR